jgi:hypothetical protein
MAKLRFDVDGDLPEELTGLAAPAPEGGGYELDLAALQDLPKINEFRANNRQLYNDKERLAQELAQAHDRVSALETSLEEGTRKVSKDKTDLETRLKSLEDQIAAKDKALGEERQRADRQRVRSELAEALTGAGVKDKALGDALAVATQGWQVDGDRLKLYHGDDLALSKEQAGEPLGVAEFAATFLKDRPHFLAESSGDTARTPGFTAVNGKVTVDANDPVAKGLAELKYGADNIVYTE